MSSINFIHTSCKNCVFALYNGIRQIGCKIDKISLWKKQGVKILEAYDEQKEFYIINKKKCPYQRGSKWGLKYPKDMHIQQVNNEVSLRYHAIIISNNNSTDVITTLNSIINQTIKPKYITILCTDTTNKLYEIAPILQQSGIPWQTHINTDTELSCPAMVDAIIIFCRHPYYAIFHAGCKVPPDMTDAIDDLVKCSIPFVLIEPNTTGSGMFVHTPTHKLLKGNKVDTIQDKIYEYKTDGIIRKIVDLCPSFPK